MPIRRPNPATKLFHAIVLFGVALTGGACGEEDAEKSEATDAGQTPDGGSGGEGGDASPWW